MTTDGYLNFSFDVVVQAVVQRVIEPMIESCVANLVASEQSDVISEFRSKCQALAETTEERQWMNRELHQPTIELRKGESSHFHLDDLVAEIQQRLHRKRRQLAQEFQEVTKT